MNRFKATVRFEKRAKSPDFEIKLNAANEDLAIAGAKQWARQCGFNGAIKTVAVIKIKAEEVTA
jgi:hypothetical protein